MSYHDLPEDIRSVPLTEAAVQADVIDLIVGIEERHRGALGVMVCDDLDRGIQPMVIADLPTEIGVSSTTSRGGPGGQPLEEALELLLPMVGREGGSVLLARGRTGVLVPSDDDRAWHQAAIDACTRHRVRLLAFYLATPSGVQALPAPLTAMP
jgi:hypothetical protein